MVLPINSHTLSVTYWSLVLSEWQLTPQLLCFLPVSAPMGVKLGRKKVCIICTYGSYGIQFDGYVQYKKDVCIQCKSIYIDIFHFLSDLGMAKGLLITIIFQISDGFSVLLLNLARISPAWSAMVYVFPYGYLILLSLTSSPSLCLHASGPP